MTTLGRDVNNSIVVEDPFASTDHAVLTFVVVVRDVRFAVPAWKLRLDIQDARRGRPAVFEGGDVVDRLYRRAGLAQAVGDVDLAVNALVEEVHRAQHRVYLAVVDTLDDHSGVGHVLILEFFDLLARLFFDDGLNLRIERGVDLQTALVDGIHAETLLQIGTHVVHEMRRLQTCFDIAVEEEGVCFQIGSRLACRRIGFVAFDITGFLHEIEHDTLTFQRAVWVLAGIVDGRRLRQTGQQGGFGQV